MRLRAATTCAIVLATTGIGAASAAPTKPLPAKPLQTVKLVKCSKFARSAAFIGRMRSIKGAERMAMRFSLFERLAPSREFAEVEAGGLAVWRHSQPLVKRFRYRQGVRALSEAAGYRMSVEFRWYDGEGEVVRDVLRNSRRCRQPGRLPNLEIVRIARRQDGRYVVRVANEGRDVAVAASVQLFVDEYDAGSVTLPTLRPGVTKWSPAFEAPPCLGRVTAVADPTGTLRESAEDDNGRTASCLELTSR